MASAGEHYSDRQLTRIYRTYAKRKGWATADQLVQEKAARWRERSTGPVGLAIIWYESGGQDPRPELGKDATLHVNGAFVLLTLWGLVLALLVMWLI